MTSRHLRLKTTLLARLCITGLVFVAVPVSDARAEDTAYCRKVRARSASEAALLIGPTLRVEGVKLPTSQSVVLDPTLGTPVPGPTSGNEYQLRASISISPLYMYKGLRVLGVGDADCEQHVPAATAMAILAQERDYGRLPALKKQADFLAAKRASWEALKVTSEQRLHANVTTLQQTEDVRARTEALERQRGLVDSEARRVELLGGKPYSGSLTELAHSVDERAMDYERKASNVRKLDAWDLRVTGGYIPPWFGSSKSDTYGILALSYNIGGAWQHASETRYLEARQDELKESNELSARLATFRHELENELARSQRELNLVESRMTVLTASREALSSADALKASHALLLVDLELIGAESERIYLAELVGQISRFVGDQ